MAEYAAAYPTTMASEGYGAAAAAMTGTTTGTEELKQVTDHNVLGDVTASYSGSVLPATGIPHGHGCMIYQPNNVEHGSDGVSFYDGGWSHGHWHGYGCITFQNGDCYVGEFNYEERHGSGVYTWSDGRSYEGTFENDIRHGHGTFTWPDGSVYIGSFNRGQRTGYGSYDFNNGNIYVGEWLNGKYHGKGKFNYADGRVYKGEWKEGQCHGMGIEYNVHTGEIRHDGLWCDHEPVPGTNNAVGTSASAAVPAAGAVGASGAHLPQQVLSPGSAADNLLCMIDESGESVATEETDPEARYRSPARAATVASAASSESATLRTNPSFVDPNDYAMAAARNIEALRQQVRQEREEEEAIRSQQQQAIPSFPRMSIPRPSSIQRRTRMQSEGDIQTQLPSNGRLSGTHVPPPPPPPTNEKASYYSPPATRPGAVSCGGRGGAVSQTPASSAQPPASRNLYQPPSVGHNEYAVNHAVNASATVAAVASAPGTPQTVFHQQQQQPHSSQGRTSPGFTSTRRPLRTTMASPAPAPTPPPLSRPITTAAVTVTPPPLAAPAHVAANLPSTSTHSTSSNVRDSPPPSLNTSTHSTGSRGLFSRFAKRNSNGSNNGQDEDSNNRRGGFMGGFRRGSNQRTSSSSSNGMMETEDVCQCVNACFCHEPILSERMEGITTASTSATIRRR